MAVYCWLVSDCFAWWLWCLVWVVACSLMFGIWYLLVVGFKLALLV